MFCCDYVVPPALGRYKASDLHAVELNEHNAHNEKIAGNGRQCWFVSRILAEGGRNHLTNSRTCSRLLTFGKYLFQHFRSDVSSANDGYCLAAGKELVAMKQGGCQWNCTARFCDQMCVKR